MLEAPHVIGQPAQRAQHTHTHTHTGLRVARTRAHRTNTASSRRRSQSMRVRARVRGRYRWSRYATSSGKRRNTSTTSRPGGHADRLSGAPRRGRARTRRSAAARELEGDDRSRPTTCRAACACGAAPPCARPAPAMPCPACQRARGASDGLLRGVAHLADVVAVAAAPAVVAVLRQRPVALAQGGGARILPARAHRPARARVDPSAVCVLRHAAAPRLPGVAAR